MRNVKGFYEKILKNMLLHISRRRGILFMEAGMKMLKTALTVLLPAGLIRGRQEKFNPAVIKQNWRIR
jgi:hypothetical protein